MAMDKETTLELLSPTLQAQQGQGTPGSSCGEVGSETPLQVMERLLGALTSSLQLATQARKDADNAVALAVRAGDEALEHDRLLWQHKLTMSDGKQRASNSCRLKALLDDVHAEKQILDNKAFHRCGAT